jgi:hypothetical protein
MQVFIEMAIFTVREERGKCPAEETSGGIVMEAVRITLIL